MGHEGHLINYLEIKGQADSQGIGGLLSQKTVIITAAVTQPAAGSIKDRAWQNHNINIPGGNKLSLGYIRFWNPAISRPQFSLRISKLAGREPPVSR